MNPYLVEITENSIQILNKQQLTKDSIVFVQVDVLHMPRSRAEEFMKSVRDELTKFVSPAKVVVSATPMKIIAVAEPIRDTEDA